MSNYPWNEAPEWANYAAIDENGMAFWYEKEPTLINGDFEKFWCKYSNSLALIIYPFNSYFNEKNWKSSLERRPQENNHNGP